jgi:hypothetical protein
MAELDVDSGDSAGAGEGRQDDDGGVKQLAALVADESQHVMPDEGASKAPARPVAPEGGDAVQAILMAAGVEYTHENSEVIGTSRVETGLSRKAAALGGLPAGLSGKRMREEVFECNAPLFGGDGDVDYDTEDALEEVEEAVGDGAGGGHQYKYNPPQDVRERQFRTMALDAGYGTDVTAFALVVESWTQEQRRDFLDRFYRKRAEMLRKEVERREEGKKKKKEERMIAIKKEEILGERLATRVGVGEIKMERVKREWDYEEEDEEDEDDLDRDCGIKEEEDAKVKKERLDAVRGVKRVKTGDGSVKLEEDERRGGKRVKKEEDDDKEREVRALFGGVAGVGGRRMVKQEGGAVKVEGGKAKLEDGVKDEREDEGTTTGKRAGKAAMAIFLSDDDDGDDEL